MAVPDTAVVDTEAIVSAMTALQHPVPSIGDIKPSSQAASIVSSRSSLAHRLEITAEEMSIGGSDIAEEIRKMSLEQKERDRAMSRQNSTRGSFRSDVLVADRAEFMSREGSVRSRISSHNASIVDVNGAARWGGYSPEAFVTSPVDPVRSRRTSWSPSNVRKISLADKQSVTPRVEPIQEGRPLDSLLASGSAVQRSQIASQHISEESSMSSQAHLEHIASQLDNAFASARNSLDPSGHGQPADVRQRDVQHPLAHLHHSGSTDTFLEAESAFRDFDGVHFSSATDEIIEVDKEGKEIRRVSARDSSGGVSSEAASMLKDQRRILRASQAPPPRDGMVYYPAPVPRMLNLPKRLSQMPAGDIQSRRRTQIQSQYGPEVRQSAPWLSESKTTLHSASGGEQSAALSQDGEPSRGMLNERMSVANFNNLPPQLRASVFFEHQSVVQDVKIESESAVATLDSILAASATAPVNAFTDHPFAGDVRRSVYAPELRSGNRRSRLVRRSASGNDLNNRQSRLSLGRNLQDAINEEEENGTSGRSYSLAASHKGDRPLTESEQIEADFEEYEDDEYDMDMDDGQQTFVQPSTLLAELQVRKAQQKSRTRTAATAYPNGMHSTLLELDAVEEIRSKRRKNHRPALAWEDPAVQQQHELESDEDVPLGMLYSRQKADGQAGADSHDWNRPLGLMEKRQLEENEPLSFRRNRLIGLPPPATASQSRVNIVLNPAEESEEDDEVAPPGETLAERVRRLKRKSVLDAAIADVAPDSEERPQSAFADEVLSQFGGLSAKDNSVSQGSSVEVAGETLGQRKARLKQEVGGSTPSRTDRSTGVANLLANNPVGAQASMTSKHQPHAGSLLDNNEQAQARHRQQMLLNNARLGNYGVAPSMNILPSMHTHNLAPPSGLLGHHGAGSRAMSGGFAAGTFSNGAGGVGLAHMSSVAQLRPSPSMPSFHTPMANNLSYASTPMTGYGGPQGYFPNTSTQAPMMNNMQAQQGIQSYVMPTGYGYPQLANMYHGNSSGMLMQPGMTYGAALMSQMGAEAMMNPNQRATIDRWRMDIGQGAR